MRLQGKERKNEAAKKNASSIGHRYAIKMHPAAYRVARFGLLGALRRSDFRMSSSHPVTMIDGITAG
jgi:hypothetical protein